MTPRRYTLGRRAESAAVTRKAIIEAAMAVYLEAGSAKAPLTVIAARADVSRGTILHHFGDADGLLDAVIVGLLETLDLPDPRILEGVVGTEARVRAYVGAMVAFYRRSTPWWYALQSELDRPAAKAGEATYWAGLAQLQAMALGPALAADVGVQQAIGGVLHPGTVGALLWALEQSGMPAAAADRVVEDLVVGFVKLRHGETVKDMADRSILPTERGRGGMGR
jgi:AcrR family transcriptional regulator